MHNRSSGVSFIASPMKKPLLRMLWCDSVAPLGNPVVPEVNWMLIGSSNCSCGASSAIRAVSCAVPRAMMSENLNVPGRRLPPGSFELSGRRPVKLGRKLPQHADVIRGLEPLSEDQRLATDLVERVFEFR